MYRNTKDAKFKKANMQKNIKSIKIQKTLRCQQLVQKAKESKT